LIKKSSADARKKEEIGRIGPGAKFSVDITFGKYYI
jgi:hypothetical protein